MPDPVPMLQPLPQNQQVATTHATGNAPAAAGAQSEATSDSQVSSMGDLKEKAPEVYKAMMEGIAMNICNDMDRHQKRLKKIQQENRRDAQG